MRKIFSESILNLCRQTALCFDINPFTSLFIPTGQRFWRTGYLSSFIQTSPTDESFRGHFQDVLNAPTLSFITKGWCSFVYLSIRKPNLLSISCKRYVGICMFMASKLISVFYAKLHVIYHIFKLEWNPPSGTYSVSLLVQLFIS